MRQTKIYKTVSKDCVFVDMDMGRGILLRQIENEGSEICLNSGWLSVTVGKQRISIGSQKTRFNT